MKLKCRIGDAYSSVKETRFFFFISRQWLWQKRTEEGKEALPLYMVIGIKLWSLIWEGTRGWSRSVKSKGLFARSRSCDLRVRDEVNRHYV